MPCKAAAKGGCASASPFGKLLRFNDDGGIPGDNPHFNTQNGVARAIWARGLRPAACGLQPAQPVHVRFATGSGRINLNDVGQNIWEEINVGTPGADCGCPASEGSDNVTAGRHRRPTAPWPVLTRSGVVHFSAPQSEIGGADNAQP